MRAPDQILTVAQMRAAEEALIAGGESVESLMQTAGRGAADWVWRIAAGRPVTVLCGPGNNGGDGYVIAEALRERGGMITVVAAHESKTDAARTARELYRGEVAGADAAPEGHLLVDCLFGSGLTRPLSAADAGLLARLAHSHPKRIAIDLPSGIDSDTGAPLSPDLPQWHLTIALGAYKFAHFLMPAAATMGALRLVPIGCTPVEGSARVIARPHLAAPAADAHKYKRGLLGIIAGQMPGAALLAASAAQHAGAGYVKLLTDERATPPDLVTDSRPLSEALNDPRWNALLVGPGLGRDHEAQARLRAVLVVGNAVVLDADALMILDPSELLGRSRPAIATPHAGEFATLERAFGLSDGGSKTDRAAALARASGMTIVAKGPDTVVADPDGRLACAPRASSWLSTAGTGDVLAGVIASRLATGADPFVAACEGVWLHADAARIAGPTLTAGELARAIAAAYAACL
ncbi:MAG: NAD(P)H-hydrate dehydratase [Novosphingobium sp.]|nr:NAD(P)H-hydrate dehydratase [Novosphingobium sp.]